jgi:thioredoxin-related protein
MLPSRFLFCFLLILFLFNFGCEGQNEIRNAVKAKTNRKVNKGKQNVRFVKDKTRGSFDRADAKINRKQQNAKRKMNAIKTDINS